MKKKHRPRWHSRRRFSKLSLAGAITACSAPRRRTVPDKDPPPFERIHEFSSARQDGWIYEGAPHNSAALRVLSERAARAEWNNEPVAPPRSLCVRGFVQLGPQRSLAAGRDGIVVLSESERLGLVDARCREYRSFAEGVALVTAAPSSSLVACVGLEQQARILSSRAEGIDVQVPTQQAFGDFASQAWVFSRFALVAYSGIDPTQHSEVPPAGLVAFALSRRDAEFGSPIFRPLAQLWSSWRRVRALPSATGVVLARNDQVGWHDWTFRCTARWYDADDALEYLQPVAIAQRGPSTHVVYQGGQRSRLLSFARPGAAPRILELPFNPAPWSALEWTLRSPPWKYFETPTAPEAWTPLPGPDGRVALAPPGHLLCYDAEGNVAWQFKRNGSAPAVLVDEGLLVEHDGALFVLDWSGKFQHVWSAPAALTARPLFHDRSWYVATGEGIHRLR